jgi:uridine kinase
LVLWDEEILSMLDLKLYVDCRPDERIVRRLRRNMTWGLSFDEIASVYLDMVRYRHDEYVEPTKWRADFILNGSKPSELADAGIVELIKSNLQISKQYRDSAKFNV